MGNLYNHFNRAVAFADLWQYGVFVALSGLGALLFCIGLSKLITSVKNIDNGN